MFAYHFDKLDTPFVVLDVHFAMKKCTAELQCLAALNCKPEGRVIAVVYAIAIGSLGGHKRWLD
jgi:hypothetical protein